MSRIDDFNMLKEQAEAKVKNKKINYDELGAYILSLLQYNIVVKFNDGDKINTIIGIGPRGIIFQLKNMLFQYAPYPNDIGGPPGSGNKAPLYVNVDGTVYQLFDETVKIIRPRKRNCSFGITLTDMTTTPELEDIEF